MTLKLADKVGCFLSN